MPNHVPLSRRTFLVAVPTVAVLASCGLRRATADELLVNGIIVDKLALLPALTNFPDVAQQQQRHIDVLTSFTRIAPSPSPIAPAILSPSSRLTDMSQERSTHALSATSTELRRILLLIAASEAVHAKVTA